MYAGFRNRLLPDDDLFCSPVRSYVEDSEKDEENVEGESYTEPIERRIPNGQEECISPPMYFIDKRGNFDHVDDDDDNQEESVGSETIEQDNSPNVEFTGGDQEHESAIICPEGDRDDTGNRYPDQGLDDSADITPDHYTDITPARNGQDINHDPDFPPITNDQERERYVRVFDADYEKYLDLYHILRPKVIEIRELRTQLETVPVTDAARRRELRLELTRKYTELGFGKDERKLRQERYLRLSSKIRLIKERVKEYDEKRRSSVTNYGDS